MIKSLSREGRTAAETAKADYEPKGVPREHLHPCDPEGRDGNNLVNCLKVYIWGQSGRGARWNPARE